MLSKCWHCCIAFIPRIPVLAWVLMNRMGMTKVGLGDQLESISSAPWIFMTGNRIRADTDRSLRSFCKDSAYLLKGNIATFIPKREDVCTVTPSVVLVVEGQNGKNYFFCCPRFNWFTSTIPWLYIINLKSTGKLWSSKIWWFFWTDMAL